MFVASVNPVYRKHHHATSQNHLCDQTDSSLFAGVRVECSTNFSIQVGVTSGVIVAAPGATFAAAVVFSFGC